MPQTSGTVKKWVFLHELGHALGLRHSANSADLMYATFNSVNSVSTYDIGVLPACDQTPATTSNEQAGIRCIYKWTA